MQEFDDPETARDWLDDFTAPAGVTITRLSCPDCGYTALTFNHDKATTIAKTHVSRAHPDELDRYHGYSPDSLEDTFSILRLPIDN